MTERKLNIVTLAEKAMGWVPHPFSNFSPAARSYHVPGSRLGPRLIVWNDNTHINRIEGWNPYDSIADAWMMVDELRSRKLWFKIVTPWEADDSEYSAGFTPFWTVHCGTSWVQGRGSTACEAICAAALRAVEC